MWLRQKCVREQGQGKGHGTGRSGKKGQKVAKESRPKSPRLQYRSQDALLLHQQEGPSSDLEGLIQVDIEGGCFNPGITQWKF